MTLLYFDGCPNWQTAARRLHQLADAFGFTLAHRTVEAPEHAEQLGFAGSPTILIEGVDPFATGHEPNGLACRVYGTDQSPAGSPTLDQLREALRRAAN